MVVDSRRRTPEGFLADQEERVVLLERRLARGVPARLSTTGQQVTDWNDATSVGFYSSNGNGAHGPNTEVSYVTDGWWTAVVTVLDRSPDAPVIKQSLYRPNKTEGIAFERVNQGGAWGEWVNVGYDTGWKTSGIAISSASGWTVDGYNLRRIGNRVTGNVNLTRTGADINASTVNGDLSPDIDMCTLPADWRPEGGYNVSAIGYRPGISMWLVEVNSSGVASLKGGMPGVGLASGQPFRIPIDYLTD